MSSKFLDIARQAFVTFDGKTPGFEENFKALKELTDNLNCDDIGLNMASSVKELAKLEHKPFLYVPIFVESEAISMVVFIIRGDATIPLHDHPMRHGLMRCIYGKLKVRSFTLNPDLKNYDPYEVQVTAEPIRLLDVSSECMILTPNKGNIHDVTAVDDVAAFYEILSPAFHINDPEKGLPSPKYFKELPTKGGTEEDPNLRLRIKGLSNCFAVKVGYMPDKIKKVQAKLLQLAK